MRDVEEYHAAFERSKGLFFGGIVAGTMLVVIGTIVQLGFGHHAGTLILAAGVALTGITIVLFPFVTPETISLFGVRRSIVIARVTGVLVVLTAIGIALTVRG